MGDNHGCFMDYDKKVLVMKETVKGFSSNSKGVGGIARIENEDGVAEFHLTVINLLPISRGDYYALVIDGLNNLYCYELPSRPLTFADKMLPCPSLDRGFSAGLCYVENFIPRVLCFGKTDNCPVDYTLFNKRVAERWLNQLKNSQKDEKADFAYSVPLTNDLEEQKQAVYDDEAVATVNYFAEEEELNEKLEKLREIKDEGLSIENEPTFSLDKEKEIQDEKDHCCNQNEENSFERKKPIDYYYSVKNELDGIFDKFSEDIGLVKTFPDSKWAKINYSKDRFYVVGLIKENGKEKYICYGVPDNQKETPPAPLEGFCSFLPLVDKEPDGFWLMFQDAKTGKCIRRY